MIMNVPNFGELVAQDQRTRIIETKTLSNCTKFISSHKFPTLLARRMKELSVRQWLSIPPANG